MCRVIGSCLLSVLLVAPAAGAAKSARGGLAVESHLARDPALVLAFSSEDPGAKFGRLIDFIDRFPGEQSGLTAGEALDEWERQVGFSIRSELFPQLGPEFAVVLDLPSHETIMAAFSNPGAETIQTLFEGTGKVVQVRDARRVDELLQQLFTASGNEITELDGVKRVTLAAQPGAGRASDSGFRLELALFYALDDDTLAVGFSPEWVRASLAPRPRGERLADGEDFSAVFSQLERKRSGLFYLNLPKIAALVERSPFVRLLAARSPRVKSILEMVLQPDYVGTGLGSASVEVEGGVRTSSFGPPGLSAGSLLTNALAAAVVPRLLGARERGRQQRTMDAMRTIASVCESYSADHGRYPGPTDGWVAVETLVEQLEPVYIRSLPRADAWGNPLLYLSDGATYRVVSTGRDGRADEDWSGEVESRTTRDSTRDIVLVDGEFAVRPESESD